MTSVEASEVLCIGVECFVLHIHTMQSNSFKSFSAKLSFIQKRGLSCIHLTVYSLKLKDTGMAVFYSTIFCIHAATRVKTLLSTLTTQL